MTANPPIAESDVSHTISVAGLDCPDEAAIVRDAVKHLPGVRDVGFDYTAGTACVRCAAGGATVDAIVQAITTAGLPARLVAGPNGAAVDDLEAGIHRTRRTTVILAFCAAGLVAAGWAIEVGRSGGMSAAMHATTTSWWSQGLYGLAIALCSIRLLPRAWSAVRARRADMYLLMVIAAAGALALGDWLEGATVCVLFLVSLALEAWSGGRARAAIAAVMGIVPTQARVRDGQGQERLTDPASVPVGSLVVVNPGERVPLDGIVTEGSSHLDESAITGESLPVSRQAGSMVYAGTVNGEALLVVQSTGSASDSTLARMTRLVAESRQRRGRTERWIDAFSARYTPAVVLIALAIALAPPLIAGEPWGTWIYRALVLLVIACPCALVIATPVATVAALARAARMGVLIKGGEHLETAARLRAIAFDKTGTLTTGHPVVVAVEPAEGVTSDRLLAVALALERRSGHPLARAVIAHAEAAGVTAVTADQHVVIPGRGMTVRCPDGMAWLGSPRFAIERLPAMAGQDWLTAATKPGGTIVVGLGDRILGVIRVADQMRPEAPAILAALRQQGISSVTMLTGDDRQTAQAVAHEAGIQDVHAELLPADKVDRIAALAGTCAPVAMVGDGVNDAPALARADLGIAMGAAGSPAALETADIALMRDDLSRLPWLVDHARRTRAIVLQNIAVALGAKAIFLILTVTGHASLWAAIAADTGVSVLVTLNALRMLGGTAEIPLRAAVAPRKHAACCAGHGCHTAPKSTVADNA
jgi:Cd2+/Zn2+-exporting ATPase